MAEQDEVAVFGGGCFWCTEAAFSALRGVRSATPGYAGGGTGKPTYEEVGRGRTGHAEVVRVVYDPTQITYDDLLDVFFAVHNPTTVNRQGNDVGPQYRSIILTTSPAQARTASQFLDALVARHTYDQPVVTEVKPLEAFYEAEAYHRRYYENNPDQAYCRAVIDPKLQQLRERYRQLLKSPGDA